MTVHDFDEQQEENSSLNVDVVADTRWLSTFLFSKKQNEYGDQFDATGTIGSDYIIVLNKIQIEVVYHVICLWWMGRTKANAIQWKNSSLI